MKKNILIIGTSSEIAQEYINEVSEKYNIYGISRKKISNIKIIKNILLNQTKDIDQKKLIKLLGKIKFTKIIFFSSDQINQIQNIYRILYLEGRNNSQAIEKIEKDIPKSNEKNTVLNFIKNSERGIIKGLLD